MNNATEHLNRLRALPWLIPMGLLFTWYLITEAALIPTYLMPHPKAVFLAMVSYVFAEPGSAPYAGRFVTDFFASSQRVLIGFSLAVSLGIPLGVLSGRLVCVHKALATTVNGMRSVPGICWLPLTLVWFGIGGKATIFLVAMAAFFPIYLNTEAGARQVNPTLLQAGTMLGSGRLSGIFSVLLPASIPNIVTGLRLGLGISWAYLVLGELTGVPNGLGAIIMDARMLGRIDIVLVGIILIALIGRMSDSGLHMLMRTCFKSARRAS